MENVFPTYYILYTKYIYYNNQHYGNLPDPLNSHYLNLSTEANEPEAAANFKLILVLLVFQNFYDQITSKFATKYFLHACNINLQSMYFSSKAFIYVPVKFSILL